MPCIVLVATWLNIKPIIKVYNGRLGLLDRVRSSAAAMERQLAEAKRFFEGTSPGEIAVCHVNARAEAEVFVARVRLRFPDALIHISDAGAVLAVHIGPGAFGLMTYRP
jgi:fatty acid-binding protein DegV